MPEAKKIDEIYDQIVSAFQSLDSDLIELRSRVHENKTAITNAPNEERLGALRGEMMSAIRDTSSATLARIDEKVGATREAILSDNDRAHRDFKADIRAMIYEIMKSDLPAHVERIIATHEERREAEREVRLDKIKRRAQTWTSIILFALAILSIAFQASGVAFNSQATPGVRSAIHDAARHADQFIQ